MAPIHKFLGGQNFLWRRGFFFCAVMPKAPYQHPLYKSIHVLKLDMHVHILNIESMKKYKKLGEFCLGGQRRPPPNWHHCRVEVFTANIQYKT